MHMNEGDNTDITQGSNDILMNEEQGSWTQS